MAFRGWTGCGGLPVPLSFWFRWIQSTVDINICFLRALAIFQTLYKCLYRVTIEEHLTLTLWSNSKNFGCVTKVFWYVWDNIVSFCLRHGKLYRPEIPTSLPLSMPRAVSRSNLLPMEGCARFVKMLVQWCSKSLPDEYQKIFLLSFHMPFFFSPPLLECWTDSSPWDHRDLLCFIFVWCFCCLIYSKLCCCFLDVVLDWWPFSLTSLQCLLCLRGRFRNAVRTGTGE